MRSLPIKWYFQTWHTGKFIYWSAFIPRCAVLVHMYASHLFSKKKMANVLIYYKADNHAWLLITNVEKKREIIIGRIRQCLIWLRMNMSRLKKLFSPFLFFKKLHYCNCLFFNVSTTVFRFSEKASINKWNSNSLWNNTSTFGKSF